MVARCSRPLVTLSISLLMLALMGCGGSSAPVPAPAPAGGQTSTVRSPRKPLSPAQRAILQQNSRRVLPPQAIAALEQLGMPVTPPNPAGSGKGASVFLPWSFSANQPYSSGDAGLIGNSGDVVITPFDVTMAPTGGPFPANFSYLLYRVDDIVGQLPGSISLDLGGPLPGAEIGVAAYNWAYGSNGRWEPLYYGAFNASHDVDMTGVPGAVWTNASDDMAFVLFNLDTEAVTVNSITLNEDFGNQPPVGDLQAAPNSGAAPLNTVLDASASVDDGTITGYRFDPEGDGTWIDNGNDATFDHQYAATGAHYPQVELTDDEGAVSTAGTAVIVSPGLYDEVEDNEPQANANTLPALPFAGYYGNCGPDGGYDGDLEDFFTFSANIGDEVSFLVEFSPSGGTDFTVQLEDSFGVPLGNQSFGYPPQPVNHTFVGGEVAPFFLRVASGSGGSDYVISGTDAGYDEFEDNDAPGSAQYLGELVTEHELVGFDASLGSDVGYPGYDGDNDDYFVFDTLENAQFDLTVTYDSPAANIGVSLLDGDLEVLASSATNDGQEDISYTFQTGDSLPFILYFACTIGGSDYVVDATITILNPGFDESEENDDDTEANALPAFPFTGFSGNVGNGGNYDGDSEDIFTYSLTAGEMLKFTITPADQFAPLEVAVRDSGGIDRIVGATEPGPGTGVVTAYVMARPNDVPDYFLAVRNFGTETDYTIDAELITTYMEVEDNDNNGEATPVPDFFNFFSGNVGTGGGNDGDTFDVYTFDANQGESVSFQLFYDETSGSTITLEIKDSEGEVLSSMFDDGQGSVYVGTDSPFDVDDVAPYYLEVTCSGGFSDYFIARSM